MGLASGHDEHRIRASTATGATRPAGPKHSGFGIASLVIGVLGGLAIDGLFQADRCKVFAVIGVVINSLILADTIGLIVLGNVIM